MMLDEDLKCMSSTVILFREETDFRDPVVVMVLSLGFIASVFLLQYDSLCCCFWGEWLMGSIFAKLTRKWSG
jgi:hypothetical protein